MSLEDKAKKLLESQKQVEINWDEMRDWWLTELNNLYTQIESWLAPLKEKGLVAPRRFEWRIDEENIGRYVAPGLVLAFGSEEIVLHPIGTRILGARGRIDLYRRGYAQEPVMLILIGSKDAPQWQIWPTRDQRTAKRLEQATFEATVETLLPGVS